MNSANASTAIHNVKELRKRDAMQAESTFNFTLQNSWKSRNGTYDKNLAPAFISVFSIPVVGLATNFGNSILLYTVCKSRKLSQNVTNIFVFSLVCADVVCVVSTTPIDIMEIIMSRINSQLQSVLGVTVCNVMGYAIYTLQGVSIHTMTLTSVNRYFCVCKPLIYKNLFRRHNSVIYAAVTWILAVTVASTSFFAAKIEFAVSAAVKVACFPLLTNKDTVAFGIFILLFYVIFPLFVMFVFYFKIFLKLQQHNAAVRPTLRAHVQGPISPFISSFIHGHFSCGPSGEGPSGEGPSGGGIAQTKEEVNITKVLVAVPLAFCVCYLPVGIAGGLYIAGWRSFGDYFPMYFMLPIALNKVLNPFILMTLSKTFRSET